ncbi:MAG: hypothetical protein AAF561_04260 [Planctomycetota bacterium]
MQSTDSFRDMLKAQPFRVFDVKTADGDTLRVIHPDYAMISPDGTEVILYDKDNHFRIVAMDLIVQLEPVREKKKKAARK